MLAGRGGREAEIERLERLVWDAVYALQRAGLDKEAAKLRKSIHRSIAGPASWKYLHQSTVSTLAARSTAVNPILRNLNQDVTSILLGILACVLLSRPRSDWSISAENCLGVRDSNPATGRSYCRCRVDT